MADKYGKLLGPKLKARLETYLNCEERTKLVQLEDEIGLSRAMLAEQIVMMSAALEQSDERLKALAISIVRDGINHVADLCTKQSAIARNMSDKVSIEQLGAFVTQLTKIIRDVVQDADTRDRLLYRMNNDLRMPNDPALDTGTTLEICYT